MELAVGSPHHVDARDVRVNAPRDLDALHLGAVLGVAEDELGGNPPRAKDLLAVVDVVEECVQRPHALAQALLERAPLACRQDPRDDVERNQALGTLVLAVDREGDADAMEERIRLGAPPRESVGRLALQPRAVAPVVAPRGPVRQLHLVVGVLDHGHPLDVHGLKRGSCQPGGR